MAGFPGTTEPLTRFQAWKTAARVHTLPAALVPVLVGAGLAAGDDAFNPAAFGWALAGALAIQVAANFANDVSDASRGADTPDRLGPPRMVAQGEITPRQMWGGVMVALTVALGAGVALTIIAGPIILLIGVASVAAMLGYVGGPAPYGYRGLGEVFVFVFFGLVATVGGRYVHDTSAPLDAWLLAIPIGMLASAILVANNYRDIDTDAAAGKRTLAVIVGHESTKRLFATFIYGALALIVIFGAVGWTPRATMLAGFLLPFATVPVRILSLKTDSFALIRALKMTAILQLVTGLAVASGAAITL